MAVFCCVKVRFEDNYIDGYQLDKDIKYKGNKIYSPNTCKFVTQSQNIIEAHAKHHRFINPQGDIVEIYNMREFCCKNNLNQGAMSAVHLGNRNHHKKWRKYCENN